MKRLLLIIITLFFLGNNVIGQIDLTSGIIARYSFSGDANDESGNGNHGIVNGAVLTDDRNGNSNSAYLFDGVDDYIDIGNNDILKVSIPFTISAWIKTADNTTNPIFANNFTFTNYFGCFLKIVGTGNNLQIGYGDGGPIGPSSRNSKIGTTEIQVDTWYHVVGVVRNDTDIDLFINGTNDGGTYSGSGDDIAYNENAGNIGRHDSDQHGPPTYFHGVIDEIYFFDRALNEEEVISLYNEDIVSVTFSTFNTINDSDGILIFWKTQSEINLAAFMLEKSIDGIEYLKIATINGRGSSAEGEEYSFLDSDVQSGETYYYRLATVDLDGTVKYFKTISVQNTLVSEDSSQPFRCNLKQNYPNPFNLTTTIQYHLTQPAHVILKIYNQKGQFIETLVNEHNPVGMHHVAWNASEFPSGLYFYKIQSGEFSDLKKLILQK